MKKIIGIAFTVGLIFVSMRAGYTWNQQSFVDRVFTFKDQNKNREWKIIKLKVKGEKRAFLITPVEMSDEEKDELRGRDLYLEWR